MKNIYLIGMPGSGKSSIGEKLSLMLDRTFVDTDKKVLEVWGRTPEEIILEEGEGKLREREHEVLLKLIGKDGLIVSTGGGLPIFGDNMALMKENGIVIYIRQEPKALWKRLEKQRRRPLSDTLVKTEELYGRRRDIYEEAHIVFEAEEDFRKNLQGIIKQVKKEFPGEIDRM